MPLATIYTITEVWTLSKRFYFLNKFLKLIFFLPNYNELKYRISITSVSNMAECRLHRKHGVHTQPVHIVSGSLLVDHVAAKVSRQKNQIARSPHDLTCLVHITAMANTHSRLAFAVQQRQTNRARASMSN